MPCAVAPRSFSSAAKAAASGATVADSGAAWRYFASDSPGRTTASMEAPSLPLPSFFARGLLVDCVYVFVFFEKIRNVQKRVTFQTQVNKRGLHPGQNARHAALMDTSRQRVLIGALEVHFNELI